MRLVWTRPASADRKAIREYIARDNPAAALVLDELLSEKAARLVDHPSMGRPGRIAGTRELVAHQNYIMIYDTVDRPGAHSSCTAPCARVASSAGVAIKVDLPSVEGGDVELEQVLGMIDI